MSAQRVYSYTVDPIEGGYEVWISDGINDVPFIHQPFNPNGGANWSSEAEASAWADQQIAAMVENDNNPKPPVQQQDFAAMVAQAQADSARLQRIEDALARISGALNLE